MVGPEFESIYFCLKNPFYSFENWLILGLELEIFRMSLEHLVVPESKKVTHTLTFEVLMLENVLKI